MAKNPPKAKPIHCISGRTKVLIYRTILIKKKTVPIITKMVLTALLLRSFAHKLIFSKASLPACSKVPSIIDHKAPAHPTPTFSASFFFVFGFIYIYTNNFYFSFALIIQYFFFFHKQKTIRFTGWLLNFLMMCIPGNYRAFSANLEAVSDPTQPV